MSTLPFSSTENLFVFTTGFHLSLISVTTLKVSVLRMKYWLDVTLLSSLTVVTLVYQSSCSLSLSSSISRPFPFFPHYLCNGKGHPPSITPPPSFNPLFTLSCLSPSCFCVYGLVSSVLLFLHIVCNNSNNLENYILSLSSPLLFDMQLHIRRCLYSAAALYIWFLLMSQMLWNPVI